MALNRFLREAVKQRMGVEFLIEHAVSDIPINVMRQIKKEAFDKYLPNDRRPIKAWGLAMASLRCLKRDLVKNRNKQIGGGTTTTTATGGSMHHMTSNAFGLSQVEVVTTTCSNEPMDASTSNTVSSSTVSAAASTTTSSPVVMTTVKSNGRRGAATIRELELNSRRLL